MAAAQHSESDVIGDMWCCSARISHRMNSGSGAWPEDLEVSILSSTDNLLFEGWFANKPARVELFQMGDGKQLSGIQLDSLMSGTTGMAGLTPQFAVPLVPPPPVPQPPASGLWRFVH
jgi:hypothetical protein